MSDETIFGITPYQVAVRCDLALSVAQSALLKSMGTEELSPEELKAWRELTGTWLAKPTRDYRELWVTAGRRSGKDTRILGCISVSCALDPKYERNGAPGERFVVLVAAPIVEKTAQLMNTDRGLFDRLGVAYVPRDGMLSLVDRPVDVKPATMTAVGASSESAKGVFITDVALGQLEEGAKHDRTFVEQARAMTLSTGGLLVSASQAWARDGVHYETVEKHWKKTGGSVLVAKGPTWAWVPQHTREMCMALAGDDPRTFRRQYEAIPGHAEDALFDTDEIAANVDKGVHERRKRAGVKHAATGDLAWRGDYASVAIGHKEEVRLPDGSVRVKYVEDKLMVWKPRPGLPLDPEAVIAEIAGELRAWDIKSIGIDQFHFDTVASRFKHYGIEAEIVKTDVASQSKRAEFFLATLRARDAVLLDDPEANRELGLLRMQLRSHGHISYAAPTTRGAHDDRSDARMALFERLRTSVTAASDVIEKQHVWIEPGCGVHVEVERYRLRKDASGYTYKEPVPPAKGTPAHEQWCWDLLIQGQRSGDPMEMLTERLGREPTSEDEIRAAIDDHWAENPKGPGEIFVGVVNTEPDWVTRAKRSARRF